MGEAIVLRVDGTITLAHSGKQHAEGHVQEVLGVSQPRRVGGQQCRARGVDAAPRRSRLQHGS
jgi:hypothetical protein